MAHGDAHATSQSDVAFLIRTRPRGSQVAVVGDINVDQLPAMSGDPFTGLPNRHVHHRAERLRLDNFCDTFGLEVSIPDFVNGCPGGPFAEFCTLAPFSRIPIGLQAGTSLPSLIDYCLAQPGMLTTTSLSWDDAPADHAWLFAVFKAQSYSTRLSRKSFWKCKDQAAFSDWLSQNSPDSFSTVSEFHAFLASAQLLFADTRSCRERSCGREPFAIKATRAQLRIAREEHHRSQLQQVLKQQRKFFLESLAQQRDVNKVCRGGALFKAKKLHKIDKMVLSASACFPEGTITCDTAQQKEEVLEEYCNKWGARDLNRRQEIGDVLSCFEGAAFNIELGACTVAVKRIKRPCKLDHYGVCPQSILLFSVAMPQVVCPFLTQVLSSKGQMSCFNIHGRLYAKSKGAVSASKTRAILPLPSILAIFDSLLCSYWQSEIDRLFPSLPSVFIGAQAHTQTLDIMHGLQGVIEKGLDLHGLAAIAQMDIKRYYDSIPILRIYRYLVNRGCDAPAAACLLRLHCCPSVTLSWGVASVVIEGRSSGALTGTRTAGLLGRVPVEDVVRQRHHVWEQWAFKTDCDKFALSTYVDNLFSTGQCAEDAVAILRDCEHHLFQCWSLRIGQDSKSFMCARGCPAPQQQTKDWAHSHGDTFAALGHILSDDGRIEPCVSKTLSNMWKCFYGNFGKSMTQAPLNTKLALLKRCVLPIASYRMSRWPYQVHTAKRIDRTQTKMLRVLMRTKMQTGEDPAAYVQRSNRIASTLAREHGKWSHIWGKRVIDWNSHLKREHNQHSWAAKILKYHGAEWLQDQRRIHAVGENCSLIAGRTCTRAHRGIVHRRWHDGVDVANLLQ